MWANIVAGGSRDKQPAAQHECAIGHHIVATERQEFSVDQRLKCLASRVIPAQHSHIGRALKAQDLGFGSGVILKRAVPVEMVRRQIEQGGHLGTGRH